MPIVDKKLRIDETLWRTARAAAALEGKTVSEWISEKLRSELATVLPSRPSYLPEPLDITEDRTPEQTVEDEDLDPATYRRLVEFGADDWAAARAARLEETHGPDRD